MGILMLARLKKPAENERNDDGDAQEEGNRRGGHEGGKKRCKSAPAGQPEGRGPSGAFEWVHSPEATDMKNSLQYHGGGRLASSNVLRRC